MKIRLSESQRQAVNHGDGALLVVAGPGSGKTRVLTERIRRLLNEVEGHFHVLALTFTNKAANEMKERLADISSIHDRAFIGTIHSFCLEILLQRGKFVGIDETPQIVDSRLDKRMILTDVIQSDPNLLHELELAGDKKDQQQWISNLLDRIIRFKTQLKLPIVIEDETDRVAYESYQRALRRSNSVDFEDLLLLTHQLLTERPAVADFFRRLYAYICVDEGQDLNFAQYQIICDLAGDSYRNIMIVGDPKQAIYGFNSADSKFMDEFKYRFDPKVVELKENFRSSSKIVQIAQSLKPSYKVEGILPIEGEVSLHVAENEEDEARFVVDEIDRLLLQGHRDIEGQIRPEECAVLSRTRYGLLEVEKILVKDKLFKYHKQWSGRQDVSSEIFIEFECCLRIAANPRNEVHLKQLSNKWHFPYIPENPRIADGVTLLSKLAKESKSNTACVCAQAIESLNLNDGKLEFLRAIDIIKLFGDSLNDESKRAVYEDAEVLEKEWDRFLRTSVGLSRDLRSFLAHSALGTTQQMRQNGLALITVHSAKGLEFDVVFVVGMAQRTFPDYRALESKHLLNEEQNNAFVAVTRCRRLLYLSYPKAKMMPWGDVWQQQPSQFLAEMNLI